VQHWRNEYSIAGAIKLIRALKLKGCWYIQHDSKRWKQTAYLLKLVIPTTNAPPRWRLNVETKTKCTLHSSRRLSFNELMNAKNLVLHSSHFAVN